MKEAIIWRESVYKNEFRCNVCKKKLANNLTGEPFDDVFMGTKDGVKFVICPDCKNPVAYCKPYYGELEAGLHGEWKGE